GTFELTDIGECLRTDVLGTLRGLAIRSGEMNYRAWGGLLQTVKTGEPAFAAVHGINFFDYLASDPESGTSFNSTMLARSEAAAQSIVQAYDFSRFGTIVDVGGGVGALISEILERNPTVSGVLFDTPSVIQDSHVYLAHKGVTSRCVTMAGDFFERIPAGDLHILQAVLHDWDDA